MADTVKINDVEISAVTHPEYDEYTTRWDDFRNIMTGGDTFIDEELIKYSDKEDADDFASRKNISYVPAYSKAAVLDVRNAIYQRMTDIRRAGGAASYNAAVDGLQGGVDKSGNSMNTFIGRIVLPELISMKKVGVYIDKDPLPQQVSAQDSQGVHPYLYIYKAEDIRNWTFNDDQKLTSLLLRHYSYEIDPEFNLVSGQVETFRHFQLIDNVVQVRFFDENSEEYQNPTVLEIDEIPFIMFELNESLLQDIAGHQVALLNLASADMQYCMKANYPFYVEQFDPASIIAQLRKAQALSGLNAGESDEAAAAKDAVMDTGTSHGRRYPKGVEAPQFIHPSPEPIQASMEKQDKIKNEIRQLLSLALTNIKPQRASAEAKEFDERGLEAGLSYIGLELEYGETGIVRIWNKYEGSTSSFTITYPRNYSLRTEDERHQEAEQLRKLLPQIPSETYQKSLAKEIVQITAAHKLGQDTIDKINKEIDKALIADTDPETIIKAHEAGLVSDAIAAKILGYPEGDVEQAHKDHAKRAARIALAQSKANQRGVEQVDQPDDRNADLNPDGQRRPERGEGQ